MDNTRSAIIYFACLQADELRQYATGWDIGIESADDAIKTHTLCDRIQQSEVIRNANDASLNHYRAAARKYKCRIGSSMRAAIRVS